MSQRVRTASAVLTLDLLGSTNRASDDSRSSAAYGQFPASQSAYEIVTHVPLLLLQESPLVHTW